MRPFSIVIATTLSCLWTGPHLVAVDSDSELAWFELSPSLSDGPATVSVHSSDGSIQGWSFGLCHDGAASSSSAFARRVNYRLFATAVPRRSS